MTIRSFLFGGRGAALLAAAMLAGLAAAAAMGAAAPWWAAAIGAALVAGAACLPAPPAPLALAPPPPHAESRPEVDALGDVLHRAAEGDLTARVTPLPDDARARALGLALNRLLDTGDAFLRQTGDALDHLGRGQAPPRLPVHGFQGDFARMAGKLNDAALASAGRADGFRRLTGRFETRVIAASDAVAAAAAALDKSADGVSQSALHARKGAQAMAETARQAMDAVAGAAQAARSIAAEANPADVRAAAEDARQAADAIAALSGFAERIEDVMRRIKRVSDFSRMLAVNASVEAARAGEAGKGFAVVAAEVQALADQSAAATREAGDEIRTVQAGLETAAAAAIAASASAEALARSQDDDAPAAAARRAALSALLAGLEDAARRSSAAAEAARAAPQSAENADHAAKDLCAAAERLSEQAADLRLELEGYLADASAA